MSEVYHSSTKRQNRFFDVKEKRFYAVPRLNRQHPYQLRRLTVRCMNQIDEEGIYTYDRVHHKYWSIYRRTLNRKGMVHRTFYQIESMIVISELGTKTLPDDPVKRAEVISEWIKGIPKKKKIGGTTTFGGRYAGFKFPSPEPGRHIMLDPDIDLGYVSLILEGDGIEWYGDDEEIIAKGVDKEYVKDRFVPV